MEPYSYSVTLSLSGRPHCCFVSLSAHQQLLLIPLCQHQSRKTADLVFSSTPLGETNNKMSGHISCLSLSCKETRMFITEICFLFKKSKTHFFPTPSLEVFLVYQLNLLSVLPFSARLKMHSRFPEIITKHRHATF